MYTLLGTTAIGKKEDKPSNKRYGQGVLLSSKGRSCGQDHRNFENEDPIWLKRAKAKKK